MTGRVAAEKTIRAARLSAASSSPYDTGEIRIKNASASSLVDPLRRTSIDDTSGRKLSAHDSTSSTISGRTDNKASAPSGVLSIRGATSANKSRIVVEDVAPASKPRPAPPPHRPSLLERTGLSQSATPTPTPKEQTKKEPVKTKAASIQERLSAPTLTLEQRLQGKNSGDAQSTGGGGNKSRPRQIRRQGPGGRR